MPHLLGDEKNGIRGRGAPQTPVGMTRKLHENKKEVLCGRSDPQNPHRLVALRRSRLSREITGEVSDDGGAASWGAGFFPGGEVYRKHLFQGFCFGEGAFTESLGLLRCQLWGWLSA